MAKENIFKRNLFYKMLQILNFIYINKLNYIENLLELIIKTLYYYISAFLYSYLHIAYYLSAHIC